MWAVGRIRIEASWLRPLDIALSGWRGFPQVCPLSLKPGYSKLIFCRYVLKNKDTDGALFVVVFTLLKKEDVEKEEAEVEQSGKAMKGKDEPKPEGEESFEPKADDLD